MSYYSQIYVQNWPVDIQVSIILEILLKIVQLNVVCQVPYIDWWFVAWLVGRSVGGSVGRSVGWLKWCIYDLWVECLLLSDVAADSEVVVVREFWWCGCYGDVATDADCHGVHTRLCKLPASLSLSFSDCYVPLTYSQLGRHILPSVLSFCYYLSVCVKHTCLTVECVQCILLCLLFRLSSQLTSCLSAYSQVLQCLTNVVGGPPHLTALRSTRW